MRLNLKTLFLLVVAAALLVGGLVTKCADIRRGKAARKDGRAYADGSGRSAWPERIPVTDTIRVAEIKPVPHKTPVVVPPQVAVASRPDTALRARLERSTMIVSIQKRKPGRRGFFRKRRGTDTLAIQTISARGIVSEARYPLRWTEPGEFTVDNSGRLHIDPAESEQSQLRMFKKERRKRRWRNVKMTAAAVGAAVLGGILLSR